MKGNRRWSLSSITPRFAGQISTRCSRKRPDGMSLEWMTAQIGPGTPGSTLPFIIEDQTPRAWRVQTSESVKGAPAYGVESVIVGVNNLDSAIALFRKAYGWAEP